MQSGSLGPVVGVGLENAAAIGSRQMAVKGNRNGGQSTLVSLMCARSFYVVFCRKINISGVFGLLQSDHWRELNT